MYVAITPVSSAGGGSVSTNLRKPSIVSESMNSVGAGGREPSRAWRERSGRGSSPRPPSPPAWSRSRGPARPARDCRRPAISAISGARQGPGAGDRTGSRCLPEVAVAVLAQEARRGRPRGPARTSRCRRGTAWCPTRAARRRRPSRRPGRRGCSSRSGESSALGSVSSEAASVGISSGLVRNRARCARRSGRAGEPGVDGGEADVGELELGGRPQAGHAPNLAQSRARAEGLLASDRCRTVPGSPRRPAAACSDPSS